MGLRTIGRRRIRSDAARSPVVSCPKASPHVDAFDNPDVSLVIHNYRWTEATLLDDGIRRYWTMVSMTVLTCVLSEDEVASFDSLVTGKAGFEHDAYFFESSIMN
jgi:hypothetical protein